MRPRRKSRQGNTILEFSLCLLVLAPALLGMFTVGMNLNRNLQAIQVARDAGHMFVRSVDFSEPKNQQLIARLARELKMVQEGTVDTPDPHGQVVMILTKVHVPTAAECAAAGLDPGDCVNVGLPTMTQRLVIGNEDLFQSHFGTPPKIKLKGKGGCENKDILEDPALRAINTTDLPPIPLGQDAYIAEVYVKSNDFDLAGSITGSGVYARAIY
jgi:hypothetical protein